MQLLLSGAVTATAALALGFAGCSTSGSGSSGSECVSTEQFFAEKIWAQTMSTECIQCHNPNGQAKDTPFVLHPAAEAGYLEANLQIVKTLAQTQRNGESILLLKPTKQVPHDGGQLFKTGSQQYNDFKTFIEKASQDETCPTNSAKFFGGAELMSPGETLRKAALVLAARLPTADEVAQVEKGGFDALNPILDRFMNEQAFFERIKESFNDQFQTDFYMLGGNALDILPESCSAQGADPKNCDPSSYYVPGWFDSIAHDDGNGNITASNADVLKYGAQDPNTLHDLLEGRTRVAVAREPLELIEYIVRNNLPFSQVLTADYTVVNPYSAPAFGVSDVQFTNPVDPFEFHQTWTAGSAPRAGVLTMPVWLSRHPTTATNRNRHRARMVFFDWLGTDILKTAERPIDPTKITDFNPTMNSPQCNVCHTNIDPIAGLFQNYQHEQGNQASYVPDFKWYQDMRPPGFGKTALPADQYAASLPWLGKQIAADPRFAISVTYNAFRMLTGQDPMLPPDPTSKTFQDDFDAYLGEYYTFSDVAKKFSAAKFNYKVLVKELVMSPYFRAKNTAVDIDKEQLKKFGPLGTAHLLTPEQLTRKVENILGLGWVTNGNGNNQFDPFLLDMNQYRLLYGGTDSENVTVRIKDPNGIMANVIERMSNEMGCRIVGAEFALDKSQRKFFNLVDASYEPKDVNGYDIANTQQAIKQQIVQLRQTLLGEKLDVSDPEVQRTFDLFVSAWQEGKAQMAAGSMNKISTNIPGMCVPDTNYITGEALKADPMNQDKYAQDKQYTLRAWMAVMTYILSDYQFVYE